MEFTSSPRCLTFDSSQRTANEGRQLASVNWSDYGTSSPENSAPSRWGESDGPASRAPCRRRPCPAAGSSRGPAAPNGECDARQSRLRGGSYQPNCTEGIIG